MSFAFMQTVKIMKCNNNQSQNRNIFHSQFSDHFHNSITHLKNFNA